MGVSLHKASRQAFTALVPARSRRARHGQPSTPSSLGPQTPRLAHGRHEGEVGQVGERPAAGGGSRPATTVCAHPGQAEKLIQGETDLDWFPGKRQGL